MRMAGFQPISIPNLWGRRYISYVNDNVAPGYWVANAGISYRYDCGCTVKSVTLGFKRLQSRERTNIFPSRARQATRFPGITRRSRSGAPRSIYGTISASFLGDARPSERKSLLVLFFRKELLSYTFTMMSPYNDYLTLMSHFEKMLPGLIHRVHYENMVGDTAEQTRLLLAKCDLGSEDTCLRFHEIARPVRTASSEQVRRPIFRESLQHWRHYKSWLEPLAETLG